MGAKTGKHEGILAGTDRATGEIKTIAQVTSGKSCDCLCPHCKTPLIAKKGRLITHHFAHEHVPESLRTCQETALHETAKIVAARLISHLHVPERKEAYRSSEKFISPSGAYSTHQTSLTVSAGNLDRLAGLVEPVVPDISPFRPDAKLQTLYGDIYVEIHVTNPVSPDKQKAMRAADLAVLEIDFSRVPRAGLSLDEIIRKVAEDAPRNWVSQGLKKWVDKARASLDASIRQREQEQHGALFRQLRETSMSHVRSPVTVASLKHKFSERGVSMLGQVPISNLRCEKGFWLADLPQATNAVVTAITDEAMINRLFAWYEATRTGKLTVLSIGDRTAVYSNDFEVIDSIAISLRNRHSKLPEKIPSLRIVDRRYAMHRLDSPLTPAKLKAMGNRAYVDEDVPADLARELLLNGFADLVVSHTSYGWEAYSLASVAKRFDEVRPSGGIREDLLYRVKYGDPCLVRFMPSIPGRLHGDVFDLLCIRNDELYLQDELLGEVPVHFDRADFWKSGGILILPDPMRQGAYHLEASNGFLRDFQNSELHNRSTRE